METKSSPPNRFPQSSFFIVGNEACERFSYYGMTSILTLYLKNKLLEGSDAEAHAKEIVHLFTMAIYFLPLVGGYLADRWWGRYRTILYISLFYCAGHAVLGRYGGTLYGVYAGLALIAIGAGGIKPNVSAFLGDQFKPEQARWLPRAYGWFYWAVNFGALFGYTVIPTLRNHKGYGWAFAVPGVLMGLATLVFWLGRNRYRHVPPAHESKQAGFLEIVWHCFRQKGSGRKFLDRARGSFTPTEIEGARAVFRILMVYTSIPVFWALYWQVNTTWVNQAEKMTPQDVPLLSFLHFKLFGQNIDLTSFNVNAETMQSAGALLVMIWIPVMTLWLYPLAEKLGLRPTPLRRMGLGMALAAVSFGICGWMQTYIDHGQHISILWQLVPYTVLEAGEVLLSATALEFAFSQAPPAMKSTIMSFWYLTSSVGNFLVATFTALNAKFVGAGGFAEFLFYAALMLVATGIFAVCAAHYRESPHAAPAAAPA